MTTPARSRDQKSAPIDDQSSAPTLPEGLRARRGSAAAWGSSGHNVLALLLPCSLLPPLE
jgi:hypothetical protein